MEEAERVAAEMQETAAAGQPPGEARTRY